MPWSFDDERSRRIHRIIGEMIAIDNASFHFVNRKSLWTHSMYCKIEVITYKVISYKVHTQATIVLVPNCPGAEVSNFVSFTFNTISTLSISHFIFLLKISVLFRVILHFKYLNYFSINFTSLWSGCLIFFGRQAHVYNSLLVCLLYYLFSSGLF